MALQAQKACEQGVPVMARKKDVMGYIAPADTQPLLDLLGGSKQLLKKFQGLLGLQLAGPSASCQTPVGKLPKTCGGTVILESFLACRLSHWCSLHSQCTVVATVDASLHSAMTNYRKELMHPHPKCKAVRHILKLVVS